MAASPKFVSIAEILGVSPDLFEGDFKVRKPEDPEKLARDHEREMLVLRLTWRISLAAIFLTALLSWIFLYYGKPEQAEKVIATMIGLIGGIGVGRTTMPKS